MAFKVFKMKDMDGPQGVLSFASLKALPEEAFSELTEKVKRKRASFSFCHE
jgi:hypothetical protein